MKTGLELPEVVPVQDSTLENWSGKSKEISYRPTIAITYPFPLGEASGGSRMTREIARHLGKLGADVIILPVSSNALDRRFPRSEVDEKRLGFEFDEELSEFSIDIIRVPQNRLYMRLDGLSVKKALRNILKQRKIDVVLSYFHEGAFLPSFLHSQNVKFGYISTWITYESLAKNGARRFRAVVSNWRNQRLLIDPHKRADILFATSRHTRDQLVDIIGVNEQRVNVCYLGVDPAFTEIPRHRPKEITNFIFVGRIIPTKGFADAIEALGRLAKKGFKNWTFRMIGEGRAEWARQAASENGIADKVTVCNAVDDQGLHREFEQAHLAIMPSYNEAFGLAFAEAQAAGIPVVAYEAGSVPEVIEHNVTGWLAPLRHVDQLANYIEKAIQDLEATYRAGLAGRERVKRMFTWEKTAQAILAGIQNLKTVEDKPKKSKVEINES